MIVRDAANRGSVLFRIDGDTARDEAGKVIARASGTDAESRALTRMAANAMSGRKVLMDLGVADVAEPSTVAEFGIPEGEYVADIASRVRFIKHATGLFYVENPLDAIKLSAPIIGSAGGTLPELNPNWTFTSFTTVSYTLAAKLPRMVIGNADFDVKRRTTILLVEALKLWREQRIVNQLTASANWAASNRQSPAAGNKWNGGATAVPLTDLFAALQKSALPANLLVMPENVAPFFFFNANSTQVRDYVQAGGQLPRVVFARQKTYTGGAPVYVWAPNASGTANNVVVLRDPGDPDRIPSACTFRWLGEASDGEPMAGMLVRTFFAKRDDAYWVTVGHYDYEAMPTNNVGAIIVGATQ